LAAFIPPLWVERGGDVIVRVHAKPKASRSRIVGLKNGALEVQIAAPPVDGAANAELLACLGKATKLPKSRVLLESGEASRDKAVRFVGLTWETVKSSLLPP
jgi:uncharacterized protein